MQVQANAQRVQIPPQEAAAGIEEAVEDVIRENAWKKDCIEFGKKVAFCGMVITFFSGAYGASVACGMFYGALWDNGVFYEGQDEKARQKAIKKLSELIKLQSEDLKTATETAEKASKAAMEELHALKTQHQQLNQTNKLQTANLVAMQEQLGSIKDLYTEAKKTSEKAEEELKGLREQHRELTEVAAQLQKTKQEREEDKKRHEALLVEIQRQEQIRKEGANELTAVRKTLQEETAKLQAVREALRGEVNRLTGVADRLEQLS